MSTPARGIVTPEAVVLDFETAGIASRGLARTLDAAVQGVILLVLVLIAGEVLGASGGLALALLVIGLAGVVLGYPIVCEVVTRGRSPGKAAFGLRVVTVDGAPESPRHAFIRSALGLIDFLLPPGGLFAVLVALPSPRNQRLGDLVAGTMVLRERTASPPAAAVWFNPPAGLESYAASLDVSPVSAAQLSVVRSFLLRVHELSSEARYALAARLATPLAATMRHQAPPGIQAEAFLVCAVAAHQRRHAPVPVPPPDPAWAAAPGPPGPPPPPPAPAWGPPPPPPPPPPGPQASPS